MKFISSFKLSTLLALSPLLILSAEAKVELIPNLNKDILVTKTLKAYESTYVVKKHIKGDLEYIGLLDPTIPENWFNLDSELNKTEGVGAERVYSEFGTPKTEDIIVAVIDSGVDVNHEDLQSKIWINSDEIAENGIDDDNNGYIDDVFGWNFIGGQDGMAKIVKDMTLANGLRLIKGKASAQVDADTLEVTREVVRLTKLKRELEEIGEYLTAEEEAQLKHAKEEVESELAFLKPQFEASEKLLNDLKKNIEILKQAGLQDLTVEALEAFETNDEVVLNAKKMVLENLRAGNDLTTVQERFNMIASRVLFNYNINSNTREIVGDNYANQNETIYGNNDVIGPDSSHGTHVAGIIAAVRDNKIGIKGVATNVKIMAVRCVPNGDERDKDVANSIRYAVDNGAKIINMSFGKAYSPYKGVVDEAVKYAEEKGVILFHAAGNSSQNNDTEANFPNRNLLESGAEASTWMEIGASSHLKGRSLPARFSNFGKHSVDIFSPGVKLMSTTPDNTYAAFSGTSMASPAAAGAAALVWSFKPELSALELKELLLSTSKRYASLYVSKPGTSQSILFSELSMNGGIIDAYNAVKSLKGKK
jgi:cell wall-associated protease